MPEVLRVIFYLLLQDGTQETELEKQQQQQPQQQEPVIVTLAPVIEEGKDHNERDDFGFYDHHIGNHDISLEIQIIKDMLFLFSASDANAAGFLQQVK